MYMSVSNYSFINIGDVFKKNQAITEKSPLFFIGPSVK
jgi:hypothetical protein